MELEKHELELERARLKETIDLIREKISILGSELIEREDEAIKFKKFMWDNKAELDPGELKTMMSDSDLEIQLMTNKGEYLKKLYRIQNNPYFGSIIFDDGQNKDNIYIGITHVEKNLNYYVHDWRSPICSLFYDYEVGPASYIAPMGLIKGNILRKRQYTIKDAKLIHVFDNNINIDDELLQEVLANTTNDKMKNIVNTIQMEQNKVIRNLEDKNLIVEGIAGSGKTSVALHRIAFLLYRIVNLSSNNVLIFSPNKVFSEYISNVLPELGEDNTMQTTFSDFLNLEIKEFKHIESFTNFIERSYSNNKKDFDIIKYKQSDEIIEDIDKYIESLEKNIKFTDGIINRDYTYTKDELNYMLRERYSRHKLYARIEFIGEKICEQSYNGKLNKKSTIKKQLYEILNIPRSVIDIYINFFKSNYSKYNIDMNYLKNNKNNLNYEDACLFIYIKSLLYGFNYNTYIKQIVIDEAQDYTLLQFKIIKSIFKAANYTILGDVNQTINPYYKYNSLNEINNIISGKYIELLKTYRSSAEIIEYSNKVLGLNHAVAIRRSQNIPVTIKEEKRLKEDLMADISELNKYGKSIGIITKNNEETNKIYDLLKNKLNIKLINNNSKNFARDLVVTPVYIAKGLEFDSVIIYTDKDNKYTKEEKHLYYVAITRSQHKLIVYNQE